MTARILYLVSHPIQYQAPLLRLIAAQTDMSLKVLFERVPPEGGEFDPGFERSVAWDLPLREGYDSALLTADKLKSEMARADAVWVHGWQSRVLRRAMWMAQSRGIPVLMRGENCDLAMPDGPGLRGLAKRLYLRRIFGKCAAFLAIGSANRDYYLHRGISPDRIHSMPYAVDNEFFRRGAAAARPDRPALRRALGLPERGKIVLFSGKLQRRKRLDLLLDAWRLDRWDSDSPPCLLIVGDGEMREAIPRGDGSVVHCGFRNQSELPAIYDLADVFVLPSEREPWGLAVNEAMACGTAVVVSDQVGCAEDLVDDTVGAVFPAGDAVRLRRSIETVLADSGRRGAAAAVRIASWDFSADLAGLRAALTQVGGGSK